MDVTLSPCLQAYNGNTALHVAASLQYRVTQLDAVRLLMRKGADPSTRNLENEQPVHLVPDGPVGEQVRGTKQQEVLSGTWSDTEREIRWFRAEASWCSLGKFCPCLCLSVLDESVSAEYSGKSQAHCKGSVNISCYNYFY